MVIGEGTSNPGYWSPSQVFPPWYQITSYSYSFILQNRTQIHLEVKLVKHRTILALYYLFDGQQVPYYGWDFISSSIIWISQSTIPQFCVVSNSLQFSQAHETKYSSSPLSSGDIFQDPSVDAWNCGWYQIILDYIFSIHTYLW